MFSSSDINIIVLIVICKYKLPCYNEVKRQYKTDYEGGVNNSESFLHYHCHCTVIFNSPFTQVANAAGIKSTDNIKFKEITQMDFKDVHHIEIMNGTTGKLL